MERFKFNVRLKQHTPMFQFQYKQDGATLRATEVKPKLDRFLIKRFGEDRAWEKWKVGSTKGQHPALDYKLNINIIGEPDDYIAASYMAGGTRSHYEREGQKYIDKAPYFADNEPIKKQNLEEARKAIISEGVNLTFFSLHTDLIEYLSTTDALSVFFALENFGLRQSKGFGSFYPANASIKDFENAIRKICPEGTLRFAVRHRNEDERIKNVFKKIDAEYKVLKGGFAKDPSQIMQYFMDKDEEIEWEKRTIKRELVKGRGIPRQEDYTEDNNIKYVRALLGVAELYEFPHDNKTKIEIKSKKIERFRSPITFKVFEDTIYITWGEIPDELYNTTFEFKNKSTRHSITMKTPPKDSLDLKDFIFNHVENTWNEL